VEDGREGREEDARREEVEQLATHTFVSERRNKQTTDRGEDPGSQAFCVEDRVASRAEIEKRE